MNLSELSPLRAAALVAGAVLILGAGYLAWQHQTAPRPETAQKVVFEPLEGVLVDRLRHQMAADFGPDAISTTLPVSASYTPIPFAQGYANLDAKHPEHDSDADTITQTEAVSGAYLVKLSNAQLCDKKGACPVVLATRAEGPELVKNALLQTNAKNVWISSRRNNGNPDLILDYGVPGMPPIRMEWRTDGQYPAYQPVSPGQGQPLPELK